MVTQKAAGRTSKKKSSRRGASSARRAATVTRHRSKLRANGNGSTPQVAKRPSSELESIYVVGLRNAHAVEKEALQVMQRQVDRVEHYPDVTKKLREHIRETEEQVERLDKILAFHDSGSSTLKDVIAQVMGNTAAATHAAAGDEILKNAFANQALEAYEIAAYKSLITMAMRQGDKKALPLLKRSLAEEERMAKWVDANIAKVTLAYIKREEQGKKADR